MGETLQELHSQQEAGGEGGAGDSFGLLGRAEGWKERFRKVKRRENRLNDTFCVIELNPQENWRK